MGKLDQNLTVFKKKILFCPKKGIDFRTMGFEICCGRQVLYFSLKKYAEEGYNNILTYQKLLVILLFNMEIRLINVEAVDVMLQWLRNNILILLVVMEITGNILCLGCV